MSEVATPEAPAVADAAPVTESQTAQVDSPAAPSLLNRGAVAAPESKGEKPADSPVPQAAKIPDKYVVKREDGTVDHEATAQKVAEGYAHLERRLGSGDAPPKSPDDYAPQVPAGLSLDELKKDPLYTGFLKGAHSRGMTNAQVSYVLDAMAQRESMRASPEIAERELRKDWPDDQTLNAGLQRAYRATAAYAGGDEAMKRLETKFGSDPDFIRLMSRVGKELHEDTPPAGLSGAEQDTLESMMASEAYTSAKHPDHARTVAKVRQLYAKKYPD